MVRTFEVGKEEAGNRESKFNVRLPGLGIKSEEVAVPRGRMRPCTLLRANDEEKAMSIFGKRPRPSLDDADFGRITQGKTGSWGGDAFQIWGRTAIQVMIDADAGGPSEEQRTFVRLLRSDHEGVRARIEQAVAMHVKESAPQTVILMISSIYVPKSPLRQIWKVWFDMEGEQHYWYGAEVQGWDHIVPFTED